MAAGSRPLPAKSDLEMLPMATPCALDARTEAQVAELMRLEELGFRCMGALEERVRQLDMDKEIAVFIRPKTGIIPEFVRLQRAIRQAIILQRELQGLRPPRVIRPPRPRPTGLAADAADDPREGPDIETDRDPVDPRDDWDKLDYRPVDEAARWIRQALGAAPPARDPFAPPDSGAPDFGPPDSGPGAEGSPAPPSPAPAARSGNSAPQGRMRATLFRTTHISPPAPRAAHPGIHHPAPAPWQPPRGPP